MSPYGIKKSITFRDQLSPGEKLVEKAFRIRLKNYLIKNQMKSLIKLFLTSESSDDRKVIMKIKHTFHNITQKKYNHATYLA